MTLQLDEGGVLRLEQNSVCVHHFDAGEEVPQAFELIVECGEIVGYRRLFKLIADRADLIEAIPATVAFHAMAQQANGLKVPLFQAGFDGGKVALFIGEESGNDGGQVGIDLDADFAPTRLRMRRCHCARVFS